MAVMHRFVLLVALAASVIPYAAATSNSCPSNQFSWRSAKGDCCLPHGGSSGPSPPSGSSCPSKWYWSSQENCCVPSVPTEPTTPSCSGSSSWNSKEQCCKPSAPVTSSKPAAPVTTSKPAAPVTTSKPAAPATTSKPSSPTTTSPPSSPSSPTECSGGDFLWNALNGKCCVPHGGHPSPPSPPPGKSCPSSWYWHDQQSCCVPNHPSPPTPTCPSNSWWGNQCCNHGAPPPKPSGHYSYKRNQKKRSTSLCPLGLQACPVSGALGLTADYECIDTNVELQSCGGCSSLDPELDCTAIEGSWNVGCEKGSCKVYSCQAGYKLARDGTSCLKL